MINQNIIAVQPVAVFNPTRCINARHRRSSISPIAEFIVESNKLHIHTTPASFDPILSNYVLLGQMSIAESYLRSIIRNIISIDDIAYKNVAAKTVSYAAAQYLDAFMMPEALMETTSFASAANVSKALEDLIAYKYKISGDLEKSFNEFEKVCQLRHCITHRFSYFGSNNAIRLGIREYKDYIEKPIQFNYSTLQSAFYAVDTFIRMLNNHLFTYLIDRLADRGEWSWDFAADRPRFDAYYNLFADVNPRNNTPRLLAYQTLKTRKK